MPDLSQEVARQMAVRKTIFDTTGTPGWAYIKSIADKIVSTSLQEALDEEDREKGETKRLRAKALQKGFMELFNAIENLKDYNPEVADESGFEF